MPDTGIRKLYRSIGEVGEDLGLEPHVLRYWESEFDELSPNKNRAGRRVYKEKDVAVARRIRYLLREEKYTLDGARQVLRRDDASPEASRRQEELLRLRGFLEKLRDRL